MSLLDLQKIASKKEVIHFIGIGGIGMSALASILVNSGFKVQGSDISENQNIIRLKKEGVKIFNGHSESNLDNVAVCVRSSIIRDDNVEIQYCKKHNINILHRSDVLAQLMMHKRAISVSGTHGKTTTTAIIGSVLEEAGFDPTVINGGIINSKGTNAYTGKGDFIVAEADESDNSFVKLPSDIAVITNIDAEHLDFYGSFDNLKHSFFRFIDQLPTDGLGVVCTDNEEVRKMLPKLDHKDLVTYGFDNDSDVRAINIVQDGFGYSFDVLCSKTFDHHKIKNVVTSVPGVHNVKNSLAAIAIALKLGVVDNAIRGGVKNYSGVKRRFTITGQVKGVTFVDDYAHHPEEIMATLSAAKNILKNTGGNLFVVFQPHKYSRLKDLFDRFITSFNDADFLYIADVYAASESPITGFDSNTLVEGMNSKSGVPHVNKLRSFDDLPKIIQDKCKANDIVMFLGAGDITQWAYKVPGKIDV